MSLGDRPIHSTDSDTGEVKESKRKEIQLACFRVGEQMYALDILRIREVIRPQKLTPVPKAPLFIEGVINLRGAVIPVVDLRKRFDQAIRKANSKARILICVLSGKIIGLVVDEVVEVKNFSRVITSYSIHYTKLYEFFPDA